MKEPQKIITEADHAKALARLETLFNAEPGTSEGDELDRLADLIVAYEKEHHG